MRLGAMLSHFVLFLFLMVFMWVGVAYVSQNIRYSSAKKFHGSVVTLLEDSDFNAEVLADCEKQAEKNGYALDVQLYERQGKKDAKVVLEFVYAFPVIHAERRYVLEGYAR